MTRGRPIEFDPGEALGAAVDVFWRKGYEATSLSDLLEAMALSKSSLYQAFGSKQQLFESCLRRYADDLASQLRSTLTGAPSGRRFIEETFAAVARTAGAPAGARGCLVANSASELGQRDAVLAAPVADGLARFTAVFREAVDRGQVAGEIASDAAPGTLATYLITCMNGLRTMIKAGATRQAARDTARLMLKALD